MVAFRWTPSWTAASTATFHFLQIIRPIMKTCVSVQNCKNQGTKEKHLKASSSPARRNCKDSPLNKHAACNKPRRPLSAYNIFFREQREQILRERRSAAGGDGTFTTGKEFFASMGKEVAKRWYEIANTSRVQHFKDLAAVDMERYRREKRLCGGGGRKPPRATKSDKKNKKHPHEDDFNNTEETTAATTSALFLMTNENDLMTVQTSDECTTTNTSVEISRHGSSTADASALKEHHGDNDESYFQHRSSTSKLQGHLISESERTTQSSSGHPQVQTVDSFAAAASSRAKIPQNDSTRSRDLLCQNDIINNKPCNFKETSASSPQALLPPSPPGRTEYMNDCQFLTLGSNHGSMKSSDCQDDLAGSTLTAALLASSTPPSSLLLHHVAGGARGLSFLDMQRNIAARDFESILAKNDKHAAGAASLDDSHLFAAQAHPGGYSESTDITVAATLKHLLEEDFLREKQREAALRLQREASSEGSHLPSLAMALNNDRSRVLAGRYLTSRNIADPHIISPATAPVIAAARSRILERYRLTRTEILTRLAQLRQLRNSQQHLGEHRTLFYDHEQQTKINDMNLKYHLELLARSHESTSLINNLSEINNQFFPLGQLSKFLNET